MKINRLLLFFLFTFLVLIVNGQQINHHLQDIDNFLQNEFPENKPGAVVLISSGDSVIYKKSYGLANIESKKPVETNMIFQIASMTKQFTAAAIMKLVENGKLSLNDTIQQYIDYFPLKKHPITVEHLLAQTSGIPEFFDIDDDEYHLLVQEHTPMELISYFKDEPLEFESGSKFRYSNSNYVLLGAIIEKVSNITYGEYLQEALFKPLGMNNTALWYQNNFDTEQIPLGYMIKDGNYVPSTPIGGSILYSSGGIVSTVDDLFKWNRALKDTTLLSNKSGSKMFTNNILTNGQPSNYGFGFFIKNLQGKRTIQHGGNLYGFTSSGLWLPDEDLFVCILSNKGFARTEEIADYIASLLIGNPIEILKQKEIKSSKLNDYIGSYKLNAKKSKLINIIVVSERLVLTFPNQPGNEVDVLPTGEDLFESKKANITLNFIRNDVGEISGIDIKQGENYNWIKIK